MAVSASAIFKSSSEMSVERAEDSATNRVSKIHVRIHCVHKMIALAGSGDSRSSERDVAAIAHHEDIVSLRNWQQGRSPKTSCSTECVF